MTYKSIFEFYDYKPYLKHIELIRKPFIRGFRARMAETANCNATFISQVLNSENHFSLEQSHRIATFLDLKADEFRYFLLLVEYSRAGTPELRDYFKNQLDELKARHLDIKGRVRKDTELNAEAQSTYYSQWYFSAIHMLVTIAQYRTIAKISEALQLPPARVRDVVAFLLTHNLLSEQHGELVPGTSYLHLDRNSPLITRHHSNWRMVAMRDLEKVTPDSIHYSTVSTLAHKDVAELREKLVQVIQEYVQTVSCSKEETMWALNLDFFDLINSSH